VAYWRALAAGEDGQRRIAVNLRLAEPAAVSSSTLIISMYFTALRICLATGDALQMCGFSANGSQPYANA
jgi:hypothetical protein